MDVSPVLVADLQAPEAVELGERPFDHLRQTPAWYQSRSLRQHLIPLPHPISAGKYSQGMPVFSTNRIPASAARSDTRGRPPLGFGGSGGSSGAAALFGRK